MTVPEIVEESIRILPGYSGMPISFEVQSIFEVGLADRGLKGLRNCETDEQAGGADLTAAVWLLR